MFKQKNQNCDKFNDKRFLGAKTLFTISLKGQKGQFSIEFSTVWWASSEDFEESEDFFW